MLVQQMKLRPFRAHVARGTASEGRPLIVIEGRIEGPAEAEVYRISAFGSKATLLPVQVQADQHGAFARVAEGEQKFDNGMVLGVYKRTPSGNRPPRVTLALHSESPAMAMAQERARPLLRRLGGDPSLVRMIAPSAWSIELAFDAEGRYLEGPRNIPIAQV